MIRDDRPAQQTTERFLLGDRLINHSSNEIDGVRVEAKAMEVLVALAEAAPNVMSASALLQHVWPNVFVVDNVVHQSISLLRKTLGDDARAARYIENIPRRGYRLIATITREAFVANSVRAERANDLPIAAEPLLGRDQDALALIESLERNRLVTVVGAGGVGKTSLALVVARQIFNRFTAGVRWVDLSTMSDPSLIVPAIATVCGVQFGEDAGIIGLARALASRAILIVLDNCEHVAAEMAVIVQALLAGAPTLKLLATSQQLLQAKGEHIYRLEALAVPESNVSLSEARRFPAIALLEQRARARDQHFELSSSTIGHAIELCRRLDGLALAIEMAAARLPALGFATLLSGLASLSSPNRDGPVRQKTLQATLEWSHRLLSDEERAVLRRLSVFSGEFELEAGQLVAASKGADPDGVRDALAALVDKSLIQVQQSVPPRFRMLLSMKEFAAKQLAASGELDATLRLHGIAMTEVARSAERSSWLLPEGSWLARHTFDYSDMQAAFDRSVLLQDAAVAGTTGEVLNMIESRRAVHGLQGRRIRGAISLLECADSVAKARLWNCIAATDLYLAPRNMSRLEATSARLSAWQQLGDQEQIYLALGFLAIERAREGDSAGADDSLAARQALEDSAWPPRRRWEGPWRLAHVRELQGDFAGCVEAMLEGLAIAEAVGDETLAEESRNGLAESYVLLGNHAAALDLLLALVNRLRFRNDRGRLCWALDLVCAALLLGGEVERARSLAREMLALHRELDSAGWAFIVLALFAARMDKHAAAAKLLGYSGIWLGGREAILEPIFQHISRVAMEDIDAAIGVVERKRFCSEGSALSQVVADALADELVG